MTDTDLAIKPAAEHKLHAPGTPKMTAAIFGRITENWSLGPIQHQKSLQENSVLSDKLVRAYDYLSAQRVYAPNPTEFNGKIIPPGALNVEISLSNKIAMFRQKQAPADGTRLVQSGDAGSFSAGGCALIVAAAGKYVFFAHAGRDCVIPRQAVLDQTIDWGMSGDTVVGSIINEYEKLLIDPDDLHVWIFFSLRPENFKHSRDHPQYGDYNQKLCTYLAHNYGRSGFVFKERAIWLDVPRIIKDQFSSFGVPKGQINTENAYLPPDMPLAATSTNRYLVAVVRH